MTARRWPDHRALSTARRRHGAGDPAQPGGCLHPVAGERGDDFSLARIWAILVKEFLQMRRDRVTMGMIVGVPLMQLMLFGFAINFNPKSLPTAVSVADPGTFSRSILAAMKNSTISRSSRKPTRRAKRRKLLQDGTVLFVVEIPENFSRDIVRGAKPDLLMEVDATDPAASGFALGAFTQLAQTALARRSGGAAESPGADRAAFHARHPPALQSEIQHPIFHRAGTAGDHPHHDHGADDLSGPDRANANAALTKICWRCPPRRWRS